MKNKIFIFIYLLGSIIGFSSCVDFLDQTPDAQALSEEDVFTDYDLSQRFIDQLYIRYAYFDDIDMTGYEQNKPFGYQFNFGRSAYGSRNERISDNCFMHGSREWHTNTKNRIGTWPGTDGTYYNEGSGARFGTFWRAIRVCNLSIKNIDRIKDLTDAQRAKILGSAYFLRGHFYFSLLQGWGGMPYITEPVDPAANMDFPRLSYSETAKRIAEDFETAAQYLPIVYNSSDIENEKVTNYGRPTKMACYAYKGKALLWGASPFSNPGNDTNLWKEAAVALGEAIQLAESSGYYKLTTLANFKSLCTNVNEDALQEIIFGRLFIEQNSDPHNAVSFLMKDVCLNGFVGGESVTENLASTFPWNNGEPINNSTSEYKTTPYYGDGITHTGRDPRFYESILFNGHANAIWGSKGRVAQIWNTTTGTFNALTEGNITYPGSTGKPIDLLVDGQNKASGGYTYTGYYIWKLFASAYSTGGKVTNMFNYIRLADIYLYYAEAANRAWGPTGAPQGISGFTMTAVESINKVRARQFGVGTGVPYDGRAVTDPIMPAFDPASADAWLRPGDWQEFEQKIRNEIRIEQAFEEKRFYDLRRWNILLDPSVTKSMGMLIDRTGPKSFNYTVVPTGISYDLILTEKNLLFPVPVNDTYLGPVFNQNPGW